MNQDEIYKKIKNLEYLKSVYCYNIDKMEDDNCISINYQIWLLKLELQKYCFNNISGNIKK
jgi:hypothetical protein